MIFHWISEFFKLRSFFQEIDEFNNTHLYQVRSRLGQTEAPSSSGHALSQVCSSLDRANF